MQETSTKSEIDLMATSATIATMVKMLEFFPEHIQERTLEHLREYLQDLRDELKWDESFAKTRGKLVAAARQATKEIREDKSTPMRKRGRA